jgi:DNA polymerase-3 subunit gamma/tau
MRDAESALDQVISFAGNIVGDEDVSAALGLVDIDTLNQTVDAIAAQDSHRIIKIVDEVVSRGYDLRNFCRELMTHLRGVLMIKIVGFDPELTQVSESDGETLARLAEAFSEQDLLRFFSLLTKTEQDIRLSSQPRFQLEMGLLKLAHSAKLVLLEDALQRLGELQSRLGGSSSQPAARSPREEAMPGPPRSSTTRGVAPPSRPAQRGRASQSSPAARAASARDVGEPPEPPPFDTYEVEPDLPAIQTRSGATRSSRASASQEPAQVEGDDSVLRIKDELAAKGKMMIVTALDKGHVTIDGDYLKVAYASGDGVFKSQVEARDKRLAIEEACQKVLGRRLSLLVVTGPNPTTEGTARQSAAAIRKQQGQSDPKLKAVLDTFHGEVIEVIKPEGQD